MNATAWILSITDTVLVSVGEFELIHIMPDDPELFILPRSPSYCQQVFVWQNKIIPVMNLAKRFGLEEQLATNGHAIVSIFAYRAEKTGLPEVGALLLNATPHRSEVSDEQACPLPTELYSWIPYVRSCFQETETKKAIPILKLERLFGYQDGVWLGNPSNIIV